jgi:hypothetical protein
MTDLCPCGCEQPGEPTWCPRRKARIRSALAELDDLAAILAASSNGHRERQHEPARGKRAAVSPSQAADDLDDLQKMLSGWEDAYRDLREWPSPPRRGYLATRITGTIAWLAHHLDGILQGPFAADFGIEILQWHREFTAKTKTGTGRHGKPVPCPRCDLKTLTLTEGDDYIRCVNPECNRRLSLAEYDEYAAAIARSCSV